jgi:hypothetical protein
LAVLLTSGVAAADDAACIAASEQSLALRKQEKLHDALKQLALCADPACPDEVKQECSRRIGDIDGVMPSIILAAKDLVGNDLDEVAVTMDGESFTRRLDGRPITIDPGEHKFHFEFTGAPPLDKTIVVREGERDRHEAIVMQLKPPPPPSFWTAQRAIAATTGFVGLVGIGLGAVFGAFAIAAQGQESTDCPAIGCQHLLQAQTDYNYAQTNATASTVLFIAGGVLAATGIVLWLVTPKRVNVQVTASGLMLRGAF